MPTTPLRYFNEDIARARESIALATTQPVETHLQLQLRSDLFRSARMFAVAALDGYFCGAYADLVAATIISKTRQDLVILPDWFYEIKFPVRSILQPMRQMPTGVGEWQPEK